MRRAAVLVLGLILAVGSTSGQQTFPSITAGDRIVVVAPHPDDDVLGAGGLIQQAQKTGAAVHIIYLTSGDHNQIAFKLYKLRIHFRASQYRAFGEMREREAIASTKWLGIKREQLTFLGYPDYGTLRIWRDYWGFGPPFRSDATLADAVPYPHTFGFGHPYKPENIVADLLAVFQQFRPTKIFVTHPLDTNPDHRAAANFVRLAVLQLASQPPPEIYYYVIHFGRWPRPYHYHPELELEPPRALLDDGNWMFDPLTSEQIQKKYEAILQHRTQLTTREYFLVSFARTNEIFATIDVPSVPIIPATAVLDWRKAIRTKALRIAPVDAQNNPKSEIESEREEPGAPTEEAQPSSLELEESAFLRQGDDLIAQVTLRNRLGKRANVHLYLYAFKQGEHFDSFPKLQVNITPLGHVHVFNNGRLITSSPLNVVSIQNRLIIRVPLKLLGRTTPDFLFAATRAGLGEASDTAWHLFSLSSQAGNVHNSE
ncbi:MAG TPA: PIG-L family deacetylase [Verrucomicrobiae bacterium]|nr:PIG-L family deacetylase [Verrucomicrobiae bacterium]